MSKNGYVIKDSHSHKVLGYVMWIGRDHDGRSVVDTVYMESADGRFRQMTTQGASYHQLIEWLGVSDSYRDVWDVA